MAKKADEEPKDSFGVYAVRRLTGSRVIVNSQPLEASAKRTQICGRHLQSLAERSGEEHFSEKSNQIPSLSLMTLACNHRKKNPRIPVKTWHDAHAANEANDANAANAV